MSPSERYNVSIQIYSDLSPFISITIFDAKFLEHGTRINRNMTLKLPAGIYLLRIEVAEQVKDVTVVLNEDKKFFVHNQLVPGFDGYTLITPPKLNSSVPLYLQENELIYESTHEYYTYPAVEFSAKNTADVHSGTGSSLFVMLRFLSKENYQTLVATGTVQKDFWSAFELEDLSGEIRMRFSKDDLQSNIEVNEEVGSVMFSAELRPGLYFLNYDSINYPRQVPIYVYANWHTQVFLLVGSQPMFGSLRILFSRFRGFDPYYRHLKLIDILLKKLQDNDFSLNDEMIDEAADAKFHSPVLGMLCAYVYLKSSSTEDDSLFQKIVVNLRDEILDDNDSAPDLRALEMLAAQHFKNKSFSKESVNDPPMFRAGFEIIKDMSVSNPDLVSIGSYNDFISVNAYYDCPFNTFKPVRELVERSKVFIRNNMFMGNRKFLSPNLEIKGFMGSIKFDDFVNKRPIDLDKDSGWVEHSIIDLLKNKETLTVNDLSKELNLSANTITRIINTRRAKLDD